MSGKCLDGINTLTKEVSRLSDSVFGGRTHEEVIEVPEILKKLPVTTVEGLKKLNEEAPENSATRKEMVSVYMRHTSFAKRKNLY